MTSNFSSQQLEDKFYLPVFKKAPFEPVRGEGVYLYEESGKQYLDFLAGIAVNALGYNHPELTRAIQDQSTRVLHVSNLFYHPYAGPLARKLARMSGLRRAFFTNSGTEAVEGAIKIARAHSRGDKDKIKFVALENSFHGRTAGALSLTHGEKYRKPFEPLLPGIQFVPPNDVDALNKAIDEDTAAFIAEPILGEGGIISLTPDYLKEASELCHRHNALMILDEIQCGLGRTGYPFYFQKSGILPDVVLLAKSLGVGLPLGAILVGEKAERALQPGDHGTTFGGGPLACRAALTFLEILERDNLMLHAAQMGDYLRSRLAELQQEFPILEIRGEGLMVGVVLDLDVPALVRQLLQDGIVTNCTAGNVLRLLPPLVIRTEHVDEFISGLRNALEAARKKTPANIVSVGGQGDVVVRKARMSDVPAMEHLINGYARENVMLPRTRTQLCETLREFVVAEVDGEFAACGALHLYSMNTAELRSLAVSEKFLKRKLGARIVHALLEDAAEYDLERVYTFTLVPDFFRKLNFRMVPHSALPEKVLSECAGCPKRDQCNEVALVYEVGVEARRRHTGI
ncbi:MAG TPA: N-acetyltransferase [Acidobacteriota bacterium]|jgi:predicted acetylornithine/succinylornithine family transaminase